MTSAVLYGARHHAHRQLFSVCELNDYVHAAHRRNLRGLTATWQDRAVGTASGCQAVSAEEIAGYLDVIDRVRRGWIDRVDVRLGVRIFFAPGNEALWRTQVRGAVFDCVVGEIAPAANAASTQPWPYFDRLTQHQAFRRAADAAETGFFDCIAFDEILESTCRWHWNLDLIACEAIAAMDRIANTGAAIEIPTASRGLSSLSAFDAWFLTEMAARQIPIVLNADPQSPWQVARGFESTLDLLSACGFSHVSHFIHRQRVDVPLETARSSLQSLESREVWASPPAFASTPGVPAAVPISRQ